MNRGRPFQVPLARGDQSTDLSQWTDKLCKNAYYINKPILGYDGYMSSMPGARIDAISSEQGADRGGIFVEREDFIGHYRVIGNNLVIVPDSDPNSVAFLDSLGVISGSDQCRFAYSFNNLAIVADKKLFYYNNVEGLRQITDPDVGNPIDIVWLQNYFVLTDGVNVYHSNILNEEQYDQLSFGTAEFRPDASLGLGVNEDSELLVFGTGSIQHFRNIAAQDFVFTDIPLKAQKFGVVGTSAKAEFANRFYVLGSRDNSSYGVYVTEGGASQKISSYAIDKILQSQGRASLGDSIVEVIELDGVELCFVHLNSGSYLYNKTLAGIAGNDNAWTELDSVEPGQIQNSIPYRSRNFVRDKLRGLWMAGDRLYGNVDFYSFNEGAQVAEPQEFILYSPLVRLETLSIDEIECETLPGFGKIDDQRSDETTAFISLTYDGVTYGKEWTLTYGIRSVYNLRFIARALGYVSDFVGFKIRIMSRTRIAIAGMRVTAS